MVTLYSTHQSPICKCTQSYKWAKFTSVDRWLVGSTLRTKRNQACYDNRALIYKKNTQRTQLLRVTLSIILSTQKAISQNVNEQMKRCIVQNYKENLVFTSFATIFAIAKLDVAPGDGALRTWSTRFDNWKQAFILDNWSDSHLPALFRCRKQNHRPGCLADPLLVPELPQDLWTTQFQLILTDMEGQV